MTRIEVVRGPLDRAALGRVAGLYGTQDPKYADLDYLATLYNDNPHGRSIHAFAVDGDVAVGHYSVIPMPIVRDGRPQPSAKGEAFFVAAGHRRPPVAIALMRSAFAAADADGIEVLHAISPRDVGRLAVLNGCREQRVADRRYVRLLTPTPASSTRRGAGRRVRRHVGWLGQRALAGCWSLATVAARDRVFSRPRLDDPDLVAQIASAAAVPETGWTIPRTSAQLGWFGRSSGWVGVAETPGPGVLFRVPVLPGGSVDVVGWNLPRGDSALGTAALLAVIGEARRIGADEVRCTDSAAGSDVEGMRRAARRLGFVARPADLVFYTRARDAYFHDPVNLRFTPDFTAWF